MSWKSRVQVKSSWISETYSYGQQKQLSVIYIHCSKRVMWTIQRFTLYEDVLLVLFDIINRYIQIISDTCWQAPNTEHYRLYCWLWGYQYHRHPLIRTSSFFGALWKDLLHASPGIRSNYWHSSQAKNSSIKHWKKHLCISVAMKWTFSFPSQITGQCRCVYIAWAEPGGQRSGLLWHLFTLQWDWSLLSDEEKSCQKCSGSHCELMHSSLWMSASTAAQQELN